MPAIKVTVGFEPLKAEVDLAEFIKLIQDITSIKLDSNTKEAVKKAIADVYEAYEMIVDTLTPFIGAKNDPKFKLKFSKEYEKFVNIRLKTYQRKVVHCGSTYNMIDKLAKNKGWKSKLPGAQKKLENLQKLADRWLLNDNRIYKAMRKYHENLAKHLDVIYNNLDNKAVKDSRKELQSVLNKYPPAIEKLQPRLDELLSVSEQL
jgi:hypothetical protein